MRGSGATHQMANIPTRWEMIRGPGQVTGIGRHGKSPEIRGLHKLARPLRCTRHRHGAMPAAKGKDNMMENETTNLFRRRDTFFGICEAVGQDFGFNPLWLRLAFIAPLFFLPVQTFIAYFALGAIVLLSRLLFPNKAAAAAAQPLPSVVEDTAPAGEKIGEMALAA